MTATICLGIAVVTTLAVTALQTRHVNDLAAVRDVYRAESSHDASIVRDHLERTILSIYKGLTIISAIPSVRSIGKDLTRFEVEGHGTVQGVYNVTGSEVSLSEVYIVPRDLDADASPGAGVHTTPFVTFDELIADPASGAAHVARDAAAKSDEDEAKEELEETEIYEYRLMRAQLDAFARAYPTIASINPSAPPLMSGSEVVTCDNSRIQLEDRRDADRSGFVFSVPLYDLTGELTGCVSGVILSNALRDQLPSGDYAVLPAVGNALLHSSDGQAMHSSECIAQGHKDERLVHSDVLDVPVEDLAGEWRLWVGHAESSFTDRADYRSAVAFHRAGTGIVVGAGILGCLTTIALRRQSAGRKAAAEALRARFADEERQHVSGILAAVDAAASGDLGVDVPVEGEGAVAQLAGAFKSFLGSVRTTVAEIADTSDRLSLAANNLSDVSRTLTRASDGNEEDSTKRVGVADVASHIADIRSNVGRISNAATSSTEVAAQAVAAANQTSASVNELTRAASAVSDLLSLISQIAFQTNLLALNASIEAARAGEAGRGFAVVAGEVKRLALQSSTTVEDIAPKINALQRGCTDATTSISEIGSIIRRIHEQQGDIARNVQCQVEVLEPVSDAAQRSASAVVTVDRITAELTQAAQAMAGLTARFHT
ncbi:MAG: methyl-accepting chemotaxis protein [Phycisphaerae bacterium]|nr:methyl-accepting chemotaxis protein [Phycisphaerae bacterium]